MMKRVLVGGVLAMLAGCSKQPGEGNPPAPEAKAVAPTPTAPLPVMHAVVVPDGHAKLVERGAYLVKAAACGVCHTAIGPRGPDLSRAFAGGFEQPDAIGTWITPNITPDKGTGIGSWTDDQIARGIREGVRPDGSQMYSIMPYMNYNRLTDDDVKAMVAFLRTLAPIENVVRPNKGLKLPPTTAPTPANAPDDVGDPLEHGAYMATLMLCSHCHWTPGANGAPQPDKLFAGGFEFRMPTLGTGSLFASNLTSDPETGLGKWTVDQIASTIQTMQTPAGKTIRGPMLFLQGGWSQLDAADVHAVAAFIHQLPAVSNKVPASTFQPSAPGGAPPSPMPGAAP